MPTRRHVLASGTHACTAAFAAAALPLFGVHGTDAQRFMLIGLTGTDNPSRASLLFAWARILAEANHAVRIDLAGDGALLIRRSVADELRAPGLPALNDLMAKAQDGGVPIYVCRPCAEARGVTDSDLDGRNAQYTNGPAMAAAMAWATKVLVL
jgi:uncharacterized protein involved in oxidation of intracellular sulfur